MRRHKTKTIAALAVIAGLATAIGSMRPAVAADDEVVRWKLASGLDNLDRARDLADVVELIRRVPLDKTFAANVPKEHRAAFRKLVDAVRKT